MHWETVKTLVKKQKVSSQYHTATHCDLHWEPDWHMPALAVPATETWLDVTDHIALL